MQNAFTQFATLNKGRITFSCADNAEGIVEMTDVGIASVKRIMNKAWREEEPGRRNWKLSSLLIICGH